ncbi:adenylyl-sulfate kinase [Clostridium tyrobutyricum]|jgi:adenylylsulfate kinase|uniref:Adenylyl-sulfate kinase n=1 Tax=Clostridium tyrobutyricum DIVETGP TaxID=1408889 RepID=W6N7X6_CLOTY|nr:adenylyl-sulfate kinase [Clostridium tyrobutyricum]AND84546.1 adenylylsulfate kinase [Clostridium tyrobutyricum]ANP69158.1 adenylyl-sulfate kinase [Clostridium tyrobutyricum]MBR9649004.1 adenylyl-sulfate kinase [Clostridium tyrobutyricum]MBV4427275.1 adenylyl-sulfate kinase [Clostridium tyrobutyricum]MBV4433454.1 adenylyl-sulfate kinase [Clostridium tyrobutyricum]
MESTNIVWHKMNIDRNRREKLLNQKGALIWFTGLSGSGKSTVASCLESKLYEIGKLTYLLDGDNVRYGLNSNLGFTKEDRSENIRRIGEVCKLFVDAGLITIASFVSPFKEDRNRIRDLMGKDFIEVYVDCPIEVCEKRDPKGIYKKARKGEIKNFTGIDSPYEKPDKPEIIVSTHLNSVEECADEIIKYLSEEGK